MNACLKRTFALTGLLLAAGGLFAQIVEEQFNYATGQLTDLSGGANVSGGAWVSYSGTGAPIQVVSGSLTYPGYVDSPVGNKVRIISTSSSAEDAALTFIAQGAGTTTYCSFLVSVADTLGIAANSSTTGDYFVALLPPGTSATTLVARISIRKGTAAGTYQLGLRTGSSNASTAWTSVNLPVDAPRLVVFSYQIVPGNSNDVASLWVDPPLQGPEPPPNLTQVSAQTTDVTEVGRLAIRQGTSTTPNATVDAIRIGSTWSDVPLPVQISSFDFTLSGNSRVILRWTTASETDNYGFEVQRSSDRSSGFESLSGVIPGHGTTNIPQSYSFTDENGFEGAYYRLKQIDLDQSVRFTEPIRVTGFTGVSERTPAAFGLEQNHPNPFNPATEIVYALAARAYTTLVVYDLLGNEVATLVDAEREPGSYRVSWNARERSSGVYFYRLTSGGKSESRKMILVK